MSCKEIQDKQDKILQFIDNDLKDKELEDFLKHINECQQCKEELEIYYSLLNGCKQLESNLDVPENFHQTLMEKIRTSEKSINKHNKIVVIKRYLSAAVAILMCFIALEVYTNYGNSAPDTKSDYQKSISGVATEESQSEDSTLDTQKEAAPEMSLASKDMDNTDTKSNGIAASPIVEFTSEETVEGIDATAENTNSEDDANTADTRTTTESKEGNEIEQNEINDSDEKAEILLESTDKDNNSKNSYGVFVGVSMILLSCILAAVFFNRIRH
jgi:hypothetical protein